MMKNFFRDVIPAGYVVIAVAVCVYLGAAYALDVK